jgi:curved DNA-binding protein CbpA
MKSNVFNTENVDLYHLLNLNPEEDNPLVIKKNFSDLIKIFHSDKSGGDSKFHQHLVEAYRILSNPAVKFLYDHFGLIGVYSIEENHECLSMLEEILNDKQIPDQQKELFKNYIKKKIKKRIYKKYVDQQNNELLSAEVSLFMQTGIFDYLYAKYLHHKTREVTLGRYVYVKKLYFDTDIFLYQSSDNKRDLMLNINYNFFPNSNEVDDEYSLKLSNKFYLPFEWKLFDSNFIQSEYVLKTNLRKEQSLGQTYYINNFLYKDYLSLYFSHVYNIPERTLNEASIGLTYAQNQFNTRFEVDVWNRILDINHTYKVSNKIKWNGSVNLSAKSCSMGVYRFRNYTSKHSTFMSVYLKTIGLFINNQCIVHTKLFALEFKSTLSFVYKPNQKGSKLASSAGLNFAIKFENFKFSIPLIISTESHIFTNALILASTIIGNYVLRLRRRWKSISGRHYEIYNKVNRKKQMEFNISNLTEYERRLKAEQMSGGLIIKYAFYGEHFKIAEIAKNLHIFRNFNNDIGGNSVFDVKVPLTLRISNSKLEIPPNLSEISGIFIPDHLNRDNLALVIMYSCLNSHIADYVLILTNSSDGLSLPN